MAQVRFAVTLLLAGAATSSSLNGLLAPTSVRGLIYPYTDLPHAARLGPANSPPAVTRYTLIIKY